MGNLSTGASVSFVVSSGTPGNAVYSATWRAPYCAGIGASCDTGGALLRGRAGLGPEANAPNTLGGTCADGASGAFHADESIDRVKLATVDGGPLRAGAQVLVTATVWAWGTTDVLDVYSAASATSPQWTFVGTANPAGSGQQLLSVTFPLPSGGTQAVRAVFRWGGTRSSCPTGPYDDKDDLVFEAQ